MLPCCAQTSIRNCQQPTAFSHQPCNRNCPRLQGVASARARPLSGHSQHPLVRAGLPRPTPLPKPVFPLCPETPGESLHSPPVLCGFLLASLPVVQQLLTVKSDVKPTSRISSFFFFLSLLVVVNYCFLKFGFISMIIKHAQSCPTFCDPMLQPARLLCPWHLSGKNTGMGCHFLLQGIFPILGLAGGFFFTINVAIIMTQ